MNRAHASAGLQAIGDDRARRPRARAARCRGERVDSRVTRTPQLQHAAVGQQTSGAHIQNALVPASRATGTVPASSHEFVAGSNRCACPRLLFTSYESTLPSAKSVHDSCRLLSLSRLVGSQRPGIGGRIIEIRLRPGDRTGQNRPSARRIDGPLPNVASGNGVIFDHVSERVIDFARIREVRFGRAAEHQERPSENTTPTSLGRPRLNLAVRPAAVQIAAIGVRSEHIDPVAYVALVSLGTITVPSDNNATRPCL